MCKESQCGIDQSEERGIIDYLSNDVHVWVLVEAVAEVWTNLYSVGFQGSHSSLPSLSVRFPVCGFLGLHGFLRFWSVHKM